MIILAAKFTMPGQYGSIKPKVKKKKKKGGKK